MATTALFAALAAKNNDALMGNLAKGGLLARQVGPHVAAEVGEVPLEPDTALPNPSARLPDPPVPPVPNVPPVLVPPEPPVGCVPVNEFPDELPPVPPLLLDPPLLLLEPPVARLVAAVV